MFLFNKNDSKRKTSSASGVLVFLSLFLSALTFATAAHAATYYVATNGSDSASGSEASPWKTIKYAVSRMNAGDTTYVKGGTYNEKGEIRFNRSGTASAPIKLMNAPGESPVIDFGVSESNKAINRFLIDAPGEITVPIGHITIEGFEIRNGYDGIKFSGAHDITIRRNWIHGGPGQGILGTTGIRILIDRNVLNNNGNDHFDHGMYLTGSDYVITNNLIYSNAGFGIQVAGYERAGSANYKPRIGPTPAYSGASNFLIANNTFAYNGAAGIVIWKSEAVNNKVINNIFYENGVKLKSGNKGTNGVHFLNSGRGNKIDTNIFYATGSGGAVMIGNATEGVEYTQSNSINVNPNFEGAGPTLSGVPNFKLKAGSPAIDKGISLLQVTWDHQGIKRPAGAAFDIGAYELCPPGTVCEQGSPPPNPTDSGGGSFTPGAPILLGPDGEVCPSGFL